MGHKNQVWARARPGATCMEYAVIGGIFQELTQWNSVFISQVWARE